MLPRLLFGNMEGNMSHFSVAVLSNHPDDVERLLEPFCENVEPKSKYAVFQEDEECDYDRTMKARGYWRNPNATWDWYQIGGRFSDMLKLLPDRVGNHGERSWTNEGLPYAEDRCDQAQVKDVDFSIDQLAYDEAIRFWEVCVEGAPLKDGEDSKKYHTFYRKEYFIEQYGTKEKYATDLATFGTWAMVTPEGEWHESGSMGWWGFNDATAESRTVFSDFLKKQLKENPDLWITIVDCHI